MRRRREVRLVGDAAAGIEAHRPRAQPRAQVGREVAGGAVVARHHHGRAAHVAVGDRRDQERPQRLRDEGAAPPARRGERRRDGARDGGGEGGVTSDARMPSDRAKARPGVHTRVYEAADMPGSSAQARVSKRRRGTAAGTAAQSTGPQSCERALARVAERRVAGLGGRQLRDRADAEGVHEPRRPLRPRRGGGSPRRRAPRPAAASRRRRGRSAAARAAGARSASGSARGGAARGSRRGSRRARSRSGRSASAGHRRARRRRTPRRSRRGASRSPSRRSGRRSAASPSGGCRRRGRERPRRPVAWPPRARPRACGVVADAAPWVICRPRRRRG